MQPNTVSVENSPEECEWYIKQPSQSGQIPNLFWSPQITVPMPLEAISDLFERAVENMAVGSQLLRTITPGSNMVYVTSDFFQASPGGISADNVRKDVLGFFSLILSYTKLAYTNGAFNRSPKSFFSIMPRSNFITLYNQVKDVVKPPLYDIVKILACYQYNPLGVEVM
jgi:hypothetical protein